MHFVCFSISPVAIIDQSDVILPPTSWLASASVSYSSSVSTSSVGLHWFVPDIVAALVKTSGVLTTTQSTKLKLCSIPRRSYDRKPRDKLIYEWLFSCFVQITANCQ